MDEIRETIFKLETELQQPHTRRSRERLSELISDDFIEFGSSGEVYAKSDVLVNLPSSAEIKFTMTDFRINTLSPGFVQSLFKTEKTNTETGKTTHSLRSSIWKNENGKWKMVFHQGTPYGVH